MDFNLPAYLVDYLARIDAFIEAEIKPLQAQDDNERFFDHRREWARTDFDKGGLPRPEWEARLGTSKTLAVTPVWTTPARATSGHGSTVMSNVAPESTSWWWTSRSV